MGCCCNKKSRLKSCGCVPQEKDDLKGFNIVSPSDDFDPRFFNFVMSATADPLVFLYTDLSVIYDRINCTDDIVVTWSTTDPSVEKIFLGIVNELTERTIPSYQSWAVLGDFYIRFTAPPAPGSSVTVIFYHEGCGTIKTQTGTISIP